MDCPGRIDSPIPPVPCNTLAPGAIIMLAPMLFDKAPGLRTEPGTMCGSLLLPPAGLAGFSPKLTSTVQTTVMMIIMPKKMQNDMAPQLKGLRFSESEGSRADGFDPGGKAA